MPYSADHKRQFLRRLSSDWEDLADELDMQGEIQRSIRHNGPDKARAIWEYLDVRDRLGELPAALRRIGRPDLADGLEREARDKVIPAQDTQLTPDSTASSSATVVLPEQPDPANPSRRKAKDLAIAITCGVVISATAAYLIPWGDDDPTPTSSCPAATPKVHGITVDYPCEGDQVQPCVMVSGQSSLPSDRTIITAVKNADGSPSVYFEPASGCTVHCGRPSAFAVTASASSGVSG